MKWILVLQPDGRFAKFQPDTADLSAYMMEREETFWWLNKKGLSLQEAKDLVYNLENDLMGYKDSKGNPINSWDHTLELIKAEHGSAHVKNLLHEMRYFHGFQEITPGMIFAKSFSISGHALVEGYKIIWSITKVFLWPLSKLLKLFISSVRNTKARRDNEQWNKGVLKHAARQ